MSKRKEPKFYQTEEFKKLYAKWVTGEKVQVLQKGQIVKKWRPSKLEKSGFIDMETARGVLKVKNKRTQSYRQQEELIRISSALMAYVENPDIRLQSFERRILELRSLGVYNKVIQKKTHKSHQTVWRVLQKHIPLALGLYDLDSEE